METRHENISNKGVKMRILILTCDKNKDLVHVFLHFYKKYWPDNPYETTILTQESFLYIKDTNVFYTGVSSWSSEFLYYLKLEKSMNEKFIFIHEDCFFTKPVDTKRVKEAENLCQGNVGCVRLNHAPKRYLTEHAIKTDIKGFREYPTDRRFSFTSQAAIWQKKYLLEVMRPGESCWETEKNGIARLKEMKTDWRILWPEINIINYPPRGLIRKGILEPPALRWAKSELSEDSMEYKILEDRIQMQREGRC